MPVFVREMKRDSLLQDGIFLSLELLLVSRVAGSAGMLGVDSLSLDSLDVLGEVSRAGAGLPGRDTRLEDLVNLLQRLTRSLGERKENVNGHHDSEDAKDDVGLPLNVVESGGDEVAERKVESPVAGSRDRVALSTQTVTEEFGNVDPRDWTPCWRERSNKQVRAGDHSLGGGTLNPPADDGVARVTPVVTVRGHETGDGEKPDGHQGGTNEQSRATAPSVDVKKGRDGHDDVDDVLDTVRDKSNVAGDTCHLENVGEVIHHYVHSCQLGPDLREHGDVSPPCVAVLEEVKVARALAGALFDVLNDVAVLDLDERGAGVAVSVDLTENLESLFVAALGDEPTRRLGHHGNESHKDDGRDHLDTPGSSERSSSSAVLLSIDPVSDEAASVANEEEDADTPCDRLSYPDRRWKFKLIFCINRQI